MNAVGRRRQPSDLGRQRHHAVGALSPHRLSLGRCRWLRPARDLDRQRGLPTDPSVTVYGDVAPRCVANAHGLIAAENRLTTKGLTLASDLTRSARVTRLNAALTRRRGETTLAGAAPRRRTTLRDAPALGVFDLIEPTRNVGLKLLILAAGDRSTILERAAKDGLTALGHDVAQALCQLIRSARIVGLPTAWRTVRQPGTVHLWATPCAHRLAAKLPPLAFLMPGQARLRLTPDHTLPASLVTLDAVGAGVGACASIQRRPGVRSSARLRGCASISSRATSSKGDPPRTRQTEQTHPHHTSTHGQSPPSCSSIMAKTRLLKVGSSPCRWCLPCAKSEMRRSERSSE